jgi:ABC-2 type transport system ATP-binding protein
MPVEEYVNPIIETVALTKRFSTATNYQALFRLNRQEDFTAVEQVTLSVKEGELFGLLGPNGAGKTTLVKMLSTLILPSEGQARVAGYDVVTDAEAIRQVVGLINAEERSFFWRLSGRENLRFFAGLHNLFGSVADARIDELLHLVGLTEHGDKRFMGYSSGMRQKLSVARGLLSLPPLIFMDEPTRSLDPVSARELRQFIRNVLVDQMGRTVLLVTHRLEEAETLCDRVAIMNQARIISCGPVDEIKRQIAVRQRYHLKVTNLSPAVLDGVALLPGVVELKHSPVESEFELFLTNEEAVLPEIMRYLVEKGGDIQQCRPHALSLEEVFVHLITEQRNAS